MRRRENSQWPVVWPALVEMQPNSKNSAHDVQRRLYMHDARFHTPRTKAIGFAPLTNGYGQVLVPHDLPVGLLRLVEKNAPRSEATSAKHVSDELPHR